MHFTDIELFPSNVLANSDRIKFDATNPEHRRAAMTFLKFGYWEIKFEMEWPYMTVPQTVLMKLAEFACQAEAEALFAERGLEYTFGNPFNTHPYTPLKVEKQAVGRALRPVKAKPTLHVVNG